MSDNNKTKRILIDDSFIYMTPKERDTYWMKKYGITFEQWQKENPPMSDDELKSYIKAHQAGCD